MKIFGNHDAATLDQLTRCVAAEEGAIGVLCADGHKGYSMPIGGVVAYREYISPSGVGYDIACGNKAVRTNIKWGDIDDPESIADEINRRISFGIGRKNNEPIDDPVLDRIAKSPVKQQAALVQMAAGQLGTVGSGNHYVDILTDPEDNVWIAVHFGSRGLGHKTATGFMNIAQGRTFDDGKGEGEMDSPPLLLRVGQPSGMDYLEAMKIAGEYAYAGRNAVCNKVLEILGAKAEFEVHNHHNFAWREFHGSWPYWVVRKGATPANPSQLGFVGGSMGDFSVILQGKESQESREALYSTVHGAGRVMSRTQAAGKQKWVKFWNCGNRDCGFTAPMKEYSRGKGGSLPHCPACDAKLHPNTKMERLQNGKVNWDQVQQDLKAQGIILRGGGADEAPEVYRPLQSVLEAHKETIEVLVTLRPKIVVMAGRDEYDPYKD